jgi:hypothetical protein
MKTYNKTLTKAWDLLGDLRNKIKDNVKEQMGWRADGPFYDRIYGRVVCTPAEQTAFLTAIKSVSDDFKKIVSIPDLFPASDFKAVTVE